MKQTKLNTENPYQDAYAWQNKIIELTRDKQIIEEEIKEAKARYESAIARGELTGKATIDGYTLKVETKTTEKRTLRMDLLRAMQPDIVLSTGKYDATLATRYLTEKQKKKLLKDADFEKGYVLGLGELDRALGGKKNSAQYVTVEITPTETKTITRLPIAPIVEV